MPRVSVILPTFNRAHLLPTAIGSVLSQSFTDWELIVVDDGSTDETPELLAEADRRIKYMQIEHTGSTAIARNVGIEHSDSEFVAFLDSDDWFLERKLDLQVGFLGENADIALVTGKAQFVDEIGRPIPGAELYPAANWIPGNYLSRLVVEDFMPVNAVLVRRATLDEVGYFNPDLFNEDYDLWLRVLSVERMYMQDHYVCVVRKGRSRKSSQLVQVLASDVMVLERFQASHSEHFAALGTVATRRFSTALISLAIAAHDAGDRKTALASIWRGLRVNPLNPRAYLRLLLLPLPKERVLKLSGMWRGLKARLSAATQTQSAPFRKVEDSSGRKTDARYRGE